MSKGIYKQIIDFTIFTIIFSGILIIGNQIYNFLFYKGSSSISNNFHERLLWLLITIFMVSVAMGVAVSFILAATRKLRE